MPFDNDRFDAFKDHRELGGTDEDDRLSIGGERHGNTKSTGFKSFVPQDITISIPAEHLEPIGYAVDENEVRSIERIFLK